MWAKIGAQLQKRSLAKEKELRSSVPKGSLNYEDVSILEDERGWSSREKKTRNNKFVGQERLKTHDEGL